jgi:hypothetical protein
MDLTVECMKKYSKQAQQRQRASVMETGNRFKNGASPKSLTSRGNVRRLMTFGLLAIVLCSSGVLRAQDDSERSLLFSTPFDKNREIIMPHLTPKTKVIRVNNYHSNGRAAYYDYRKKCWGYIDQTGKIMIPARYQSVHDFSDGLAAVQNDGNWWGFIDTEGQTAIEFKFSIEPKDFSEGLAVVAKRAGTFAMMDKTGQIVVDNLYSATPFMGGKSVIELPPVAGKKMEKLLLHRDLKTAERGGPAYPKFMFYDDGIMYYDLEGVLAGDANHYVLYAPRFQGPFRNGLAPCLYSTIENGLTPKRAYINKKGEVVILFDGAEF